MTLCWLARFSEESCDGPPVWNVHLIERNFLSHEFPRGAVRHPGGELWRPLERKEAKPRDRTLYRSLAALIDNPRSYVKACGSWNGIGGHHHDLDHHQVTIYYEDLPPETIEFAAELGIGWRLRKDYPSRTAAAA